MKTSIKVDNLMKIQKNSKKSKYICKYDALYVEGYTKKRENQSEMKANERVQFACSPHIYVYFLWTK